jgi:PPOX class probable F420-dependent enzyme
VIELTPLARELLAGANMGIVATINADGSPQQSVVWVRERDGAVQFVTFEGRVKHRNLVRDARAGVLILDAKDPYRYSHVRGTAVVESEPTGTVVEELSWKYWGRAWHGNPAGGHVLVSVIPERISEYGA